MGRRGITKSISGYPASAEGTMIPNLFFSSVFPNIDEVEELVVSAYFFFAQGRKKGSLRTVSVKAMTEDRALIKSLSNLSHDPQNALILGLNLAVKRGTLIKASDDMNNTVYLLNTPSNRKITNSRKHVLNQLATHTCLFCKIEIKISKVGTQFSKSPFENLKIEIKTRK